MTYLFVVRGILGVEGHNYVELCEICNVLVID